MAGNFCLIHPSIEKMCLYEGTDSPFNPAGSLGLRLQDVAVNRSELRLCVSKPSFPEHPNKTAAWRFQNPWNETTGLPRRGVQKKNAQDHFP